MPVSIRFKGVVGTTAQLESDKYAGRIGFNTTLARYVCYFDATNYATMARRDVLETFAAGIQDSTLTAGRVMLAGTSGRLQGDAGLTYSQVSGVTRRIIVGDGLVASNVAAILRRTATFRAAFEAQDEAGFTRWGMRLDSASTDWLLTAQNASGSDIDNPIRVVNASGGTMTFGGTTARTANFTGAIQTSGVTRISSGGAGTLTTLSTTGLATLAQATVSDLTAGQPMYASTGGRVATESVSAFRSRLGIAGADRIDRSLKSAGGTGWVKFCTLKVTTQNHSAMATVDVVTAGRNLQSDRAVCRVFARIRQTSAMSSPLDIIDVRYIQQGGISPGNYAPSFGYVIVQNDASAKIVDVYLATVGTNDRFRYTVIGTWSDLTANAPVFYEDSAVEVSQPVGYVAALREDLVVEALRSNALTGELPVYADANKTLQTESASAFLTRIAAIGSVEKGAANGVAPLGANSKISATYLPSYVDDVIEVANFAALPGTGESGKIYVTLDTNKTWRWSGSAYVEISASLVLGETSDTAYRGDRGKTAYDHSQLAASNPHGTTFAQIASKPTTLAGYGITDAQPLDSDLTAIAALTTTSFGRSLLTQADAAASRALIGAASSAGSTTFANLFTGRRTLTGLTNGVTGVLIPTYTFAANSWATGMEVVARFSLFSTRDGQIEMKLGGNSVSSIALPGTTRCMVELILTCQSAGASARFAYTTRITYPGTSGTPIDEVIFGDSQAFADGIGDGWTVNTTASLNLTFDYTPSTGSDNPVVHSGTIRISTP